MSSGVGICPDEIADQRWLQSIGSSGLAQVRRWIVAHEAVYSRQRAVVAQRTTGARQIHAAYAARVEAIWRSSDYSTKR